MTISKELLDELLKGCERPEDLLGDAGLMKELKIRLMERMLGADLTAHLGYEESKDAPADQANRRNVSYAKMLKGQDGTLPISVPRDRDGSFEPELVKKGQEGAVWHGHFDCNCYHPNFLFHQFGMLERCALRNGNVHSADGWRDVLDPVIARYAGRDLGGRFFRADAAYAIPAIYERLEEAGYSYFIRLPMNTVLKEKIAHRLTRPVGRPSLTKVKRFYKDFEYQAASWDKERRVIAKIEWHPGELFPKIGFIVTNLPMEPDWVVRFYNQRGTAEQHVKEGKYAFRWTRLSCRKFRDNEVRLQLHALAYNLATFLRCIDLPEAMVDWSLTRLQLKLIKIGARVVRHARAITFQLAEVAVTGPMVRAILADIRHLRASLPARPRSRPKLNEYDSIGLLAALNNAPKSRI